MKQAALSLVFFFASSLTAFAIQPRHVPVPEDQGVAPQIELSGTGLGTLDYGRLAPRVLAESGVNFDDSSILIGAAQRLYHGAGVGSFNIGGVTNDQSIRGVGTSLFLNQANVDYQSETFEALIGRTDNPSVHLIDFPTLRGDDLITLLSPLNPFSTGDNVEEHRYSNVASVTLNQGLKYFENIHTQHLLNSAGIGTDTGINSFGVNFEYLGPSGMDAFQTVPMFGLGYEHIAITNNGSSGLNQIYAGGIFNLNESVTNRIDLRAQDIYSFGSNLNSFQTISNTFQADSNSIAASLRYLYSPFGQPGYQLSLTTAYKSYVNVDQANSLGLTLTGVKRLGDGFDLVAQYLGQWRNSVLAAAQSTGSSFEQVAQLGFIFNFGTIFNQHLAPRRSLLNEEHHYITN